MEIIKANQDTDLMLDCSRESLTKLNEVQKDIEHGFRCLQMFRSEYLMRKSVLAMHPTVDGKYWQAVLERSVHFHELNRLRYDFKEKVADIDIMKAELAKMESDMTKNKNKHNKTILSAKINKSGIQIERAETDLVFMRKEAEQRTREVLAWSKIIDELKPVLEFSPDDPEEHQEKEWKLIYANKLKAMDLVKGQSDMDGAINNLIVGNEIFREQNSSKN